MKIALLTDGIYPHVLGGMQRHSYYLAKYLAANGVLIDLYHVVKRGEEELIGFTDEEKRHVRSIPVEFPSPGSGLGHYIRESYAYSKKIYELLIENGPVDLIYAKGFSGWESINRKKKGKKLPPIGVNFHGYEMFQYSSGLRSWIASRLLFRAPVRFNTVNADAVFSYGGKISVIINSLGVPKQKIIEIPSGISSAWLATQPGFVSNPVRFIFIGRNERRKGVKELVSALKVSEIPIDLTVVGPFSPGDFPGIGKVNLAGEIRASDALQERLSSADVLICPSLSEGMPNVILEAMARGLAIIATDTGATSMMVDGKNGWLVEPGDINGLKNAIAEALAMAPGSMMEKKKVSLERVKERFLWEQIAIETIQKLELVAVRKSEDTK